MPNQMAHNELAKASSGQSNRRTRSARGSKRTGSGQRANPSKVSSGTGRANKLSSRAVNGRAVSRVRIEAANPLRPQRADNRRIGNRIRSNQPRRNRSRASLVKCHRHNRNEKGDGTKRPAAHPDWNDFVSRQVR